MRRSALLVVLMLVGLASPALAEKRVALVIGNSAYQNVAPLENPVNDAALMADTLKGLGFSLTGNGAQLNLDKRALDDAVQAFGRQVQGADVAMFYYAGHGVQVRGSNFLVPINANPTREADVDFQMVDLNLVLNQMQGAGTRLNMVILDACRNNPFGGRGLRGADGKYASALLRPIRVRGAELALWHGLHHADAHRKPRCADEPGDFLPVRLRHHDDFRCQQEGGSTDRRKDEGI